MALLSDDKVIPKTAGDDSDFDHIMKKSRVYGIAPEKSTLTPC
jgi:hypothetical protein